MNKKKRCRNGHLNKKKNAPALKKKEFMGVG
jgi:hypothetical protein